MEWILPICPNCSIAMATNCLCWAWPHSRSPWFYCSGIVAGSLFQDYLGVKERQTETWNNRCHKSSLNRTVIGLFIIDWSLFWSMRASIALLPAIAITAGVTVALALTAGISNGANTIKSVDLARSTRLQTPQSRDSRRPPQTKASCFHCVKQKHQLVFANFAIAIALWPRLQKTDLRKGIEALIKNWHSFHRTTHCLWCHHSGRERCQKCHQHNDNQRAFAALEETVAAQGQTILQVKMTMQSNPPSNLSQKNHSDLFRGIYFSI